jgi:O-antigen/teichoic acid export membrane protein
MTVLRRNIATNFLSQIWTGLMGLVFVPFYISFLGVEAYGLVGFFATLMATFSILDMGLSTSISRELARLSSGTNMSGRQEMRDLLRTLEVPYGLVALLIGGIVLALAPFLASSWINSKNLSPDTVEDAIALMGVVAIFQWPLSLYSGGLVGLERQALLNGINSFMATVRGAGAIVVLWAWSPSLENYFKWQVLVSAAHTIATSQLLWRSLPSSHRPSRVHFDQLKRLWRFAVGAMGIGVLSTLITQTDKIVLSRLVTLEAFGYYSVASLAASNLYRFVMPVFTAVFPRLTKLSAEGNGGQVAEAYHKSAQLTSSIIFPVAILVAVYSRELLLLWTQNEGVASAVHVTLSVLVCGSALHSMLAIPLALQLAYGWTRLRWTTYASGIVLLQAPLLIALTRSYGPVGAAYAWCIVNLVLMLAEASIMHRRLLKGHFLNWLLRDVACPLAVTMVVILTPRLLGPQPSQQWTLLLSLALQLTLAIVLCLLTCPHTRPGLANLIRLRLQPFRDSYIISI